MLDVEVMVEIVPAEVVLEKEEGMRRNARQKKVFVEERGRESQ